MREPLNKEAGLAPKKTTHTKSSSRKEQPFGAKKTATTDTKEKMSSKTEEQPIGAIMTKGIELAEAGLNLGINLVHKLGATVQGQVLDNMAKSGINIFRSTATAQAQSSEKAPTGAPEKNTKSQSTEAFSGITNRLPAFAGGHVRLSFSINNDSVSESRLVAVSIEQDLMGELTGTQLSAEQLALSPSRIEVAPADFEKFVIVATIPRNQQADHYHGTIVVADNDQIRIPLRICVEGSGT